MSVRSKGSESIEMSVKDQTTLTLLVFNQETAMYRLHNNMLHRIAGHGQFFVVLKTPHFAQRPVSQGVSL